jgi:hypothetical protein
MGSTMDKVTTGVNITAKILVSLLWLAGGIVCFAAGVWYLGLVAIAYLIYLWVFGGRWLIY